MTPRKNPWPLTIRFAVGVLTVVVLFGILALLAAACTESDTDGTVTTPAPTNELPGATSTLAPTTVPPTTAPPTTEAALVWTADMLDSIAEYAFSDIPASDVADICDLWNYGGMEQAMLDAVMGGYLSSGDAYAPDMPAVSDVEAAFVRYLNGTC